MPKAIAFLLFALLQQAPAPQPAGPPTQDEPLTLPAIVYPALAREQRIQGTVHLEIAVDAAGQVFGVKALDGPLLLRQAAIDAYAHATYKPLLHDGRPAPAIVTTAVIFHLDELPPDSDQIVDKQFSILHSNCQELSLEHAPNALQTCRQAVDYSRRFSPGAQLEARATAYNDLVLLLIANGKYAGHGSAAPNPDLPEAAVLADQAIDLIAGSTAHTPAVAVAYITRAEVRSLQGDLKGSAEDCATAEETLNILIQDQAKDLANDRTANYRGQLKETLLLHAIVLERQHRKKDAERLRAEAERT